MLTTALGRTGLLVLMQIPPLFTGLMPMQLPQPVPSQPESAQPEADQPDFAHLPNSDCRGGQPQWGRGTRTSTSTERARTRAPRTCPSGCESKRITDGDNDRVPRSTTRGAPHPIQPTVRGIHAGGRRILPLV